MRFEGCALAGVFRIIPEPHMDSRGLFARTFCAREFADRGLETCFVQCNTSFNTRQGTLRGLHFQRAPNEEVKLVRCVRGSAFDVVVDLRANSPTYLQWVGLELTAENREAIYIPKGCAHGFQSLSDDTELLYQMSVFYCAESSGGLRWNDPALRISWPIGDPILSERDAAFPDFKP